MDNLCKEAEQIMIERFGRDTIIALATTENDMPYVRSVSYTHLTLPTTSRV